MPDMTDEETQALLLSLLTQRPDQPVDQSPMQDLRQSDANVSPLYRYSPSEAGKTAQLTGGSSPENYYVPDSTRYQNSLDDRKQYDARAAAVLAQERAKAQKQQAFEDAIDAVIKRLGGSSEYESGIPDAPKRGWDPFTGRAR